MKLMSSSTSPYAQKVRVVAIEKGIDLTVENVLPLNEGSAGLIQSPLGKVPSLVLDHGKVLFDSPVICAYLDTLDDQTILWPLSGEERWQVEGRQALADGIMDAAFSSVMEQKRPDVEPSQFWLSRWRAAIDRSLAALAKDIPESIDVGSLASACALNYLLFRLPDINWPETYPDLANWHREITLRESFRRTALG